MQFETQINLWHSYLKKPQADWEWATNMQTKQYVISNF